MLWLAVFVVLPLGAVLLVSLLLPSGAIDYIPKLTLHNYLRLLQPPYPAVFAFSIAIAATTTAICLLLAFPLSLAIAFAPVRWRLLLLFVVCLPFWISTLIRMYALQEILGRKGLVNQAFLALGEVVSDLLPFVQMPEPLELIYNRTGVLIGLVYAFIPFAVLPLYANLVRLDRRLLEASRDLGAGALATVLRVILPLSGHGIAAAAVLVFIPALGAFYVVDMLGGTGDLLIGNLIQLQFHDANNWPLGGALSVALLVAALGGMFVTAKLSRRAHG